jgi:predicted Fe-Mo cluster-binding NifX family protein
MNWLKALRPWLLAAGLAVVGTNAWADGARIAVSAEAAHAEAAVSKVAARAPFILIFDAAGKMVESHPNPAAANPGGAGPALASWLAEKQVGTLVAGDFGAKLAPALQERKIRAVTGSGPAAQAVKKVVK